MYKLSLLLFFGLTNLALAAGGLEKGTKILNELQTWMHGIAITVVALAGIWVAMKIAFKKDEAITGLTPIIIAAGIIAGFVEFVAWAAK